jgi:hypothetical protein
MNINLHYPIGARTSVRFTFLKRSRCGLKSALLAAVFAFFTHAAFSQTWQTVDDFQYVAGQGAANTALAMMPNGALLAAGHGYDASSVGHALVMSSVDGGFTWSALLDDFTGPILGDNPWYTAVGSDPAGNPCAAGTYYDANDPNDPNGNGTDHWFVRRSSNGGVAWSTVDDVAPFSGSWFNQANAVAADAAGNVYVAGYLNTSSSTGAWTVRKSIGGASFATVDSLPSNGGIIGATAICVHPTLGMFVAGQADVVIKGVTVRAWIVRRSTNGGATWSTVDTFYGTKGANYYFGRAYGVGADTRGNLYVAGALAIPYKGSSVWEWVVRKSTNGGGSWSTVDTYQLGPSGESIANGFVTDSSGNLYVAGYATTSGSLYFGTAKPAHWTVRMNPGGTGAWQTVDDFQYVAGFSSFAHAITANASRKVFVGGAGGSSSGDHWLVRKR